MFHTRIYNTKRIAPATSLSTHPSADNQPEVYKDWSAGDLFATIGTLNYFLLSRRCHLSTESIDRLATTLLYATSCEYVTYSLWSLYNASSYVVPVLPKIP